MKASIVKYYQTLILRQLVEEVIRNLHGKLGKHREITKTLNTHRMQTEELLPKHGITNEKVGAIVWVLHQRTAIW